MATLEEHLQRIAAHDLICADSEVGESAYLFRHALLQEAAYNSLLRTDRTRLHSVVGTILETLYPQRSDELAAVLAYHFAAAGDHDRALHYYTLAGEQALAAYAGAEAEAYFQAALALRPPPERQAQLLVQLGEAQFGQSCFPVAIASWQAAVAAYSEVAQADGVAWSYARITRAVWYTGDLARALAEAQAGLAAVGAVPDSHGRAALLHEAARATHLSHGPVDTARRLATQALEMAVRLGVQDIESDTRITLGILPDQPLAAALAQLRQAATLAEAIGRPAVASRAHYNLAGLLVGRAGDAVAALDHASQAAAASRLLGHAAGEFLSSALEVQCHLLLGNLRAGTALLERVAALQHSRSRAEMGDTPQVLALRAQLCAVQGDRAGAMAYGEQALIGARRADDRETILLVGLTLGEVAWAAGDPQAALPPLTEALAALEPNDPGVALIGLLAAAHAAAGDGPQAEQLLETLRTGSGPAAAADQAALALATARLAVTRGDWAAALPAFAVAAHLYGSGGLRPQHAQTLLEWAATHSARAMLDDAILAADYQAAARAIQHAMTAPVALAKHPAL